MADLVVEGKWAVRCMEVGEGILVELVEMLEIVQADMLAWCHRPAEESMMVEGM